MNTKEDKWIRLFDITETNKHVKGFVIYKVTSMLYPQKCPDAITKLTVWKRYNDFKKLYREIKVLHKKYKINDKLPTLTRGMFFNKYDKQALIEKKESALNFLEFVAKFDQLFTSIEFVKFFETSFTPIDHLNGNIVNIRSDLNLPEETEDETNSDTDSINTTLSNVSKKSTQSICTIESITLLTGHTLSENDESYDQYIIDASVHLNLAEELENERKFDESFVAYKTAIDILLKHGKNEKNYERKRLIKYKTEKYLIRAEKLYNMYLAPEVKDLKFKTQENLNKNEIKPLISDLYKLNVIRIIDKGMLVVNSDNQKLYYVKVINKTTKYLNDNLILPENVPFMVKLINYYDCDNALFLVLEYINGLKLTDYLNNKEMINRNEIELSDNEDDEQSFIELLNDYVHIKNDTKETSIIDEPLIKIQTKTFEEIDNENKTIKWISQLILALEKLHILGVTCKDLRLHNIIIDENINLNLTYMCNVKERDLFKCWDLNLAPEIYGINEIGPEADWWSLGAILYKLLVGMDINELHTQIFSSSTIVKVPKYVSPEGRSLIKQLLVYEPKSRLGVGQHGIDNLKSHPFFKNINWNLLYESYK